MTDSEQRIEDLQSELADHKQAWSRFEPESLREWRERRIQAILSQITDLERR